MDEVLTFDRTVDVSNSKAAILEALNIAGTSSQSGSIPFVRKPCD
jgi:hypothetical protein